jgi:hypothetical protein
MLSEEELKEKTNVEKYLEQMNSLQKKAYQIASSHLKSSFNVEHSNGYKEYLKNNVVKK